MKQVKIIKYAIPVIAFILNSNITISKHTENNRTDSLNRKDSIYKYWAIRSIIESTHAYMQDYLTTINTSKDKPEIKGIEVYYSKFIVSIEKLKMNDSTLNEVSKLLSENAWKNTEKRIFNVLRNKYIENKPLDSNFFKIDNSIKGGKIKLDNYSAKTKECIEKYQNALETQFSQKEKSKKVRNESPNTDTARSKINTAKRTNNFLSYISKTRIIIGIISILISATIVLLVFKYLYNAEEIKRDPEITDLKKSETNIIESYKETNVSQGDPQSKKEDPQKPGNKDITEEGFTIIEKRTNKNELFFSIPEPDGSFRLNISNNEQSMAYYKIITLENSQEGELVFISGTNDRRAINRMDSYLKPVCYIENPEDATRATSISMLQPGKVVKDGDRWILKDVDSKIKIKLI